MQYRLFWLKLLSLRVQGIKRYKIFYPLYLIFCSKQLIGTDFRGVAVWRLAICTNYYGQIKKRFLKQFMDEIFTEEPFFDIFRCLKNTWYPKLLEKSWLWLTHVSIFTKRQSHLFIFIYKYKNIRVSKNIFCMRSRYLQWDSNISVENKM